jgi:hypothetical protein
MRILLAAALAFTAGAEPLRYVNPLSIEGTRSIADPCVLKHKGKYYLFVTGGGAVWSSDNLLRWIRHPLQLPRGARVTAPHAFEYRGEVYLTGNDTGFYRAKDVLGPWTYAGDIHDEKGKPLRLFDSMVFVDDDGKAYLYYSGRRTDGIYGVELRAGDLTRFAAPARKLWTFDPSHVWERYGDQNEGTELSWIEAPWMTKHKGTYYLQYSAPGTEWKTYAVGVYTSSKPLGPFRYAPRNPALVHRGGLINGTGHNSVVTGPDGKLWAFYTILYRNWSVFDRRIGMDRVEFDAAGSLYVAGPTETPQWGPGGATAGAGSIAISLNRYTWSASSAAPGRDPHYAFDNNVRTWWEPAQGDPQPWLLLDLGCRNPTDPNQEFFADSARILFDAVPHPTPADLAVVGHSRWFAKEAAAIRPGAYRYKVEFSRDGKSFTPAVDKTKNQLANNVEFDEFPPVLCRYVRLAITGVPETGRHGVLEFTVFGKSAGPQSPAAGR